MQCGTICACDKSRAAGPSSRSDCECAWPRNCAAIPRVSASPQSGLPPAWSCPVQSPSAARAVLNTSSSTGGAGCSSRSNSSSPFIAPRRSASDALASLPERKIERGQQGARLIVGARRRAYGYIHAPHVGGLVVVDFRKHDVFLDAEREIAAAVETLRIKAAEIAYPRQCNVDQPIEKLVHPRFAQRDLAADRLPVAQLVSGDGFARLGNHRLLTGNAREIGRRGVDLFAVGDTLGYSHIDDDLIQGRNLETVLIAELFGEPAANLLVELDLQPRRDLRLRRARLCLGFALRRFFSLLSLLGLPGLRRLVALLGFVGFRRLARLACRFRA